MSVKQRLYPDDQQAKVLIEHCGQARFVYNNGLAKRQSLTKEDRKNGVRVNFKTQCKDLSTLRKNSIGSALARLTSNKARFVT